jgi:hypothetical protein
MITSREVAVSQRVSEAMRLQSEAQREALVAEPDVKVCNVGSDLLQRLGWREGRGLGREGNEGPTSLRPERILAPRAGLGAAGALLGLVGEASAQPRSHRQRPAGAGTTDTSDSDGLVEHARVTAQRYSEILRKEGNR